MNCVENHSRLQSANLITKLLIVFITLCAFAVNKQVFAQATFAGNAQHTGVFTPPATNLNVLKWQTDIDLNVTGLSHYGSPVVSANNTVIVPVKISATGFRVDAFNGSTGAFKYTLATDYIMPAHNWIPSYNLCIVGTRLYYAGAGGTMLHVDNIDSNSPSAPVRDVFYTTLANYTANQANFNNTVFINTPITADTAGNIFFGFRVQGAAPAPLSTTQSGLARISSTGTGTFVLASVAAGNDAQIDRDSHNAGPALSNDETSIYFPVKSSTNVFYSYLVELNSTTLTTKNRVFLRDPRNSGGARVHEDGTSTPMVGPDGDVYFGVFGNTGNGSRGFLLHFSSDLQTTKIPGGFGWDYTPGMVPASMVPSYTGSSSYLIFCKYNDYPSSDSSGVNKVAVLDPNATQIDPHATSPGLIEMREVLSVLGFTPDDAGPGFPFAVQEFCINAPAVNPATKTVYFDSEDGHLYRWNLATNSVEQGVVLTPGILQPYVPTVIGPDGTLYTLNGGNLFAVGTKPGIEITIASSSPDLRRTVVGDSITFTATVAGSVPAPTGTVTFTELSYNGLTAVTTTLATNVPLDSNGRASVTTSTLVANATNFGNHFITATYNGDGSHQSTSVTMVQKVHRNPSVTTLTTSNPFANPGDSLSFTATTSCIPNGAQMPCGFITFYDGQTAIGQMAPNSSGQATLVKSDLSTGVHNIRAVYTSDVVFAMSESQVQQGVGPVVQFNSATATANEGAGHVDVQVSLMGSSQTPVTVQYSTSDTAGANQCTVTNGAASSRCDYLTNTGTLTFAPGQTTKTISIPIIDDVFAEGSETFTVTLGNVVSAGLGAPSTAIVTITDNEVVNGTNPIDNTDFFVRQHYLDFLNREPDTAGFNFWKNEIDSCGANAQCIEVKRINVSAAFFLPIEFQQTGYFVERVYKAAYGDATGTSTLGGAHTLLVPIVRLNEFQADKQQIGDGVVVGAPGWEALLNSHKDLYVADVVQRTRFTTAFPAGMTPATFVDTLNSNAENPLSTTERNQLVTELTNGTKTRAQVLRAVAEDGDLETAEFRRAFVLAQYFGYMRRNPNDPQDSDYTGYDFWLTKLNQFNGNFANAEMVKSFLLSGEYRHRFGP